MKEVLLAMESRALDALRLSEREGVFRPRSSPWKGDGLVVVGPTGERVDGWVGEWVDDRVCV